MTPDMQQALAERRHLIETRAEAVLDTALHTHEPWVTALGPIPAIGRERQQWRRRALVVAAYRDRYQITDPAPLGTQPEGVAQKIDRARAEAAVRAPLQSSVDKSRRQADDVFTSPYYEHVESALARHEAAGHLSAVALTALAPRLTPGEDRADPAAQLAFMLDQATQQLRPGKRTRARVAGLIPTPAEPIADDMQTALIERHALIEGAARQLLLVVVVSVIMTPPTLTGNGATYTVCRILPRGNAGVTFDWGDSIIDAAGCTA